MGRIRSITGLTLGSRLGLWRAYFSPLIGQNIIQVNQSLRALNIVHTWASVGQLFKDGPTIEPPFNSGPTLAFSGGHLGLNLGLFGECWV